MKLPLPRTLFARLMLIWLLGIAVVLAVSYALFLGERHRHDRDLLLEGLTRELTAAVDVLDRLSPDERDQWIEALGRRRLRFALQSPPPGLEPLSGRLPLVQSLDRALPGRQVALFTTPPRPDTPMSHGRLIASLQLADGSPLTIRLPLPHLPSATTPWAPERALAALAALVAGVTLLAWIAVRLATRPLTRLAAAAQAIGEDPNRPALDVAGPDEVARATAAFNRMQQRIREHVGERTRILAAISHDLQTPITRLRLRAEMIEDEALRARVQSDLDAMQALAREGLDFARSLDITAPLHAVDLNGLIEALCDDARDMGWTVGHSGLAPTPCHAQPVALRRALWNLIENGVKFGEHVEIALEERPNGFEIRVRDHGPGIPDAECEKVFEPFYRTESSRNRETGGTGLGLAIARNLLRAQGGDVVLESAPGGGSMAIVSLPKQSSPQ